MIHLFQVGRVVKDFAVEILGKWWENCLHCAPRSAGVLPSEGHLGSRQYTSWSATERQQRITQYINVFI